MIRWQPLVVSAVVCGVVLSALAARADWINGKMPHKVPPAVDYAVRPFPLEQVRLTEGPFRAAQERDRAYLRSV